VPFYADLHIHSKYSRATSRHCDLEHLALWAGKKGITVVGTGDFTHPAWLAELKNTLIPAEPGLFRLPPEQERAIAERLPRACHGATRFMLCVEISTIYKKGERTRKIHHLIYAAEFATAEGIIQRLAKIGNLASDGRPILGLDSRHLLEIVLEAGPDAYLVPAHIWTPWFAALGSKSGFDAIDECYADLAPHIFAVETGLSSDPPMNWRVSSLDRFRLVSNSDAHSPEKLGREACVFATEVDYFAIRRALETGQGYEGTVEFFPEEGKYHLDGHRNCHVRMAPHETRERDGRCPVCGKPVTVGVMHRVEELADRQDEAPPGTAGTVQSLVPLPEVLSEILRVGAKSRSVARHYERLLDQLGPELTLLTDVPLDDIRTASSSLVAEAIARLRQQQVIREAGFDGAYGTIRLFHADELQQHTVGGWLFGAADGHHESPTTRHSAPPSDTVLLASQPQTPPPQEVDRLAESASSYSSAMDHEWALDLLTGLDAEQRSAVETVSGPLLIVAGPGSGKTRTLTHRIAHLIRHYHVPAGQCLAITFTRRAADEMRQRLRRLLPEVWEHIPIMTFHALGLSILQEHHQAVGLQRGFRIATDAERLRLLRDALGGSESQAGGWLAAISRAKRTRTPLEVPQLSQAFTTYRRELEERNLVDYDDLIGLAVALLEAAPEVKSSYQNRYAYVCIDEYQDVDEQQVRLIKLLVPAHGNLCAIGDPDQAIYGFRGADAGFFERFAEDFPGTCVVRLRRNYRCGRTIVTASSQIMARAQASPGSVPVRDHDARRITLYEAPSERAEAEFVVQAIEQMIGGHSFFSIDSGRSVNGEGESLSFADFAVLYRTAAQTPALVEALHRSGMPFQTRSHDLLMDHPGVPVLINELLKRPGESPLRQQLEAAAQSKAQEPEAQDVTREALELLKPLADACGEDLEKFLADLALGVQVDSWDPRADRIALLTLHAAKGLQFPVVFIVGCEEGLLPLRWGQPSQADLDEERRLFYVGITRAQTSLYLCHARQRLWRGRVRQMSRSSYLDDIEEHLLERQRARLPGERSTNQETQLELF
jgi:DNA helicase-2/ATP-dependent DNA helicase PcrA